MDRWADSLLEDNEVQREALAQRPHHGELVEQGPGVNELREAVLLELLPAFNLVCDRIVSLRVCVVYWYSIQ